MLLSQTNNSQLVIGIRESEIPLQQYERGDEIAVLDSGIWQVYRGVVQLSRIQPDGNETILGWVGANGIFENIINNALVSYRAVALTDVYVRRYSINQVMQHPLLARQLITQLSDRLLQSEQLLAIIALRKVEERLRQLLLMLKEEIGQPVSDGIRLQARFTHQHLAEAIHTTRVTITRILGDWREQDLIYFDQERHLIIKNLVSI
ncbi:putative transcriptional regulator, Crp/Fnr family protein [Chondrocystis sp. NIES-4102]|nr:putative transcriptional regulator, Crp/Fnr family protein [Chondrocystis sp. NIES-4102]